MALKTELLDYSLPEELIAQTPLDERSESRLLVMRREDETIAHRKFCDIEEYLRQGDLLVVNDSRVFPARLFVNKETGGKIELLFLRPAADARAEGEKWEALAKPGRRLKPGMELFHEAAGAKAFCRVGTDLGGGLWEINIPSGALVPFLEKYGVTPLPPYIKTNISDPGRYQTVYAEKTGSTAAPTAGMHFTRELMDALKSNGIKLARVTLHIGMDTFRPIAAENLEDHEMHSEIYFVPDETASAVCETIRSGGRVVAVGTTSVRSLESWAAGRSRNEIIDSPRGGGGATRIFIYRREQFRIVDALITNFHLPKTTLLALVCAFAGRDFTLKSYQEAVRQRYRFFSFGDAMLIL